jgi:Ca2+-binding RTX toxin-like protein
VLDGGTGADTMAGGAGDDTYIVDDAGDVVVENPDEGTDTVQSFITYTLGANVENLTLTGSGAINGTGNSLDNILTGNSAANVLAGGTGNDTYIVDALDTIVENANEGVDTVFAGFTYTLGANLENLTLTGTSAINGIGNSLDNILTGNSAANVLTGGAGNDTYIVDALDTIVESAGGGIDTVMSDASITLGANLENAVLTGTANTNATGNSANNQLTGNSGNNILNGGTGADAMAGGAGNDTYVVDNAGDTVTENANEGIDLVQSSVSFTLGANVENLTLTGASAINGTGNALNNVLTGNSGVNTLTGGAGDDTLDGGAGADILVGGTGDDTYIIDATDTVIELAGEGIDTVLAGFTYTLSANLEILRLTGTGNFNGTGNASVNILYGNSGNNILDGQGGADFMSGGAGNDTYIVDNVLDQITENPGEGTDTVQSSITWTLGAELENLTLTGTSAINGTGNALNNVLTGNSAANILDGGAGADTMAGGAGDDTYTVDNAGDVVTEAASAGIDLVQSSVTYTLTANVENLTLTGGAAINGTGNTLDNVITGNGAANTLTGGAGNDTLNGAGGADTMIGGTGNDTYFVDNAGDVVVENLNEGTDTVNSSITYTLTANVENLTLTGGSAINGTGNALNNVLTGNGAANTLSGGAGNDTLDGGAGADTLIGGLGNDTYIVDNAGDVVTENANEGTDLVKSSITYTLTANVENLTLTGSGNINGTGNALNNVLTGNAGNNILTGGDGNDTLDGGAGNDTLIGGLGNDIYIVDSAGDVVIENPGEGTDTVQSSITWTLGAEVENLTLIGTSAINGTGNALNNVLTGNSGNNILIGGAGNDTLNGGLGADTMIGGAGNDVYTVDNVGDVVTEYAGEGTDTVNSSITWSLGANLENLTLTGTSAINGTGNALDNVLTGNSAANVLTGGAGNDTYIVGVGDTIVENANEGIDLVQSSVTFSIAAFANVENLTLTGTSAINSTGNALDNILIGNSGVNTLTGGAGNDTLDGMAGADTLVGGTGDDTYIVDNASDVVTENAGEGFDTINSSVTKTISANVEKLVLTGASAINATGSAADDYLVGNTGNNTLTGGVGNDLLNGGSGTGVDTINGDAGYDVLEGMDGNDILADTAGNNLFNGGAGNDTMTGNSGNELFIGGAGNDTINTGTGADIVAFNRGDGQDTVNLSTGGDNTLSLGGGIRYSDLTLTKSGNDLLFNLGGSSEKVTFAGWYASTANRSVSMLQMIVEACADFDANSSDPLVNKKVASFDFLGIVDQFDAGGQTSNWAVTNALLTEHLAGSDTEAMGGDLAYRYGLNGSLANIGFDPAVALMSSGAYGTAAQTLQPTATLEDGIKRLS